MSTIEKTNDFFFNVARRMISNVNSAMKFGRNSNVNISSQDIWSAGATWVAPTAARLHNIKSTNANDTAAGSGARTVLITGLDSAYAVQSETITLNGTTNVPTVNTYTMINDMVVSTTGGDATNDGVITATAAVDLTVTAQINTGIGQAQSAIYQVPAGFTGYILDMNVSVQAASTANISVDLLVQESGSMFVSKYQVNLISTGNNVANIKFPVPLRIAAQSIVKLRCSSNANNTDVSGSFTVVNLQNNV
jgi:hypothetical protein